MPSPGPKGTRNTSSAYMQAFIHTKLKEINSLKDTVKDIIFLSLLYVPICVYMYGGGVGWRKTSGIIFQSLSSLLSSRQGLSLAWNLQSKQARLAGL